jgi:hypothetical protein
MFSGDKRRNPRKSEMSVSVFSPIFARRLFQEKYVVTTIDKDDKKWWNTDLK